MKKKEKKTENTKSASYLLWFDTHSKFKKNLSEKNTFVNKYNRKISAGKIHNHNIV